jgi:polar amino acid transport system ATP-binding protein
MKVHGWNEERANKKALELLSSVDLSDKVDSFPSQLSGGQKQRVAIARALAMEPEIMLFDEPTSALDPEMIKEVLDVIRDIAQSNTMTVIIVTHEMGFAKEIADYIVFMDDGRIIEQKSPKEFFSSPEHPRSIEFLDKVL